MATIKPVFPVGTVVQMKPWFIIGYAKSHTFKKHGWVPRMNILCKDPMTVDRVFAEPDRFSAHGFTWHSKDFFTNSNLKIPDKMKLKINQSSEPEWWKDFNKDVKFETSGVYTTRWIVYKRKAAGFWRYETVQDNGRVDLNGYKLVQQPSTACFASLSQSIGQFYRKYGYYPNKITYLRPKPPKGDYLDTVYRYYQLLQENKVLPDYFNIKRMAYNHNAGFKLDGLTLDELFSYLAVCRIASEKQAYYHALIWLVDNQKQNFWLSLMMAQDISQTYGHHFINGGALWRKGSYQLHERPRFIVAAARAYHDWFTKIPSGRGKKLLTLRAGYNSLTMSIQEIQQKNMPKKDIFYSDLRDLDPFTVEV